MVWTGVLLLDYDAVEGAGAVLTHRLYIEAAGSEADEKVSRGWQCCLSSPVAATTAGETTGWGVIRRQDGALRYCWTTAP